MTIHLIYDIINVTYESKIIIYDRNNLIYERAFTKEQRWKQSEWYF